MGVGGGTEVGHVNLRSTILFLPTHPHPGLPLEGEGGSGLILPFRGRTEVGVGRRTEVGMGGKARDGDGAAGRLGLDTGQGESLR